MAPRDPHDGRGRLAAVLDPRPGDRGADVGPDLDIGPDPDETPTLPLRVPQARWRSRLAARWVPASWRGARFDPGRPAALAMLLTATLAALLAAVGVWWEAPRAERAPDLPALVDTTRPASSIGLSPDGAAPTGAAPTGPAPTGPAPTGPAPAAPGPVPAAPAEPLVVAVAGKVARPGLVRVPAGARVADVLVAAGGALPGTDLTGVNLARRVRDGEQVAVGVPGATDAALPPAPPGPAASGVPDAPLDLNTATVEQLDLLPGVGPVMAQRIVEWRTRNGRFATVDQLREVEGIGERRLGQLRGLVRV